MTESDRRAAAFLEVLLVGFVTAAVYAALDAVITTARRGADAPDLVPTKFLGLMHAVTAAVGGYCIAQQTADDMIHSSSTEVPFYSGISAG